VRLEQRLGLEEAYLHSPIRLHEKMLGSISIEKPYFPEKPQ
jgi:hypothetical protein